MAEHFVRDLIFSRIGGGENDGFAGRLEYSLFHFLRVCGWSWLWECDGGSGITNPTHIADGSMDDDDLNSWNAEGTGSLLKVTSGIRSGERALQVTGTATNDGVVSDDLLYMTDSVEYQIAIWAKNSSGANWEVAVDTGTGSYTTLGNIPDNSGVWTKYNWSFTTAASGTRTLRIRNLGTGGEIITLDGIAIWRSYFEYTPFESGSDGILTNPTEFSTAGSYTPVAGDIGKYVVVYDPTNPTNSGIYQITSVTAGVATLELRSGSATFTTQSGLSYRLIDTLTYAPYDNNPTEEFCGFGLQSPHSSNWRYFTRRHINTSDNDSHMSVLWMSPVDTDFNFETGDFYLTGPSTQNTLHNPYSKGEFSVSASSWSPFPSYTIAPFSVRNFIKVDGAGAYFSFVYFPTAEDNKSAVFVGSTGTDADHPGIETWVILSPYKQATYADYNPSNQLHFSASNSSFAYPGVGFGPDSLTRTSAIGILGYGSSNSVKGQSNAGPNPFSSEEVIHNALILRGKLGGEPDCSIRESSCEIYVGRSNLTPLMTFDSDQYIHFLNGLIWKWNGTSLV